MSTQHRQPSSRTWDRPPTIRASYYRSPQRYAGVSHCPHAIGHAPVITARYRRRSTEPDRADTRLGYLRSHLAGVSALVALGVLAACGAPARSGAECSLVGG